MKKAFRIALAVVALAFMMNATAGTAQAAKTFSGTMNINTATEQELTQLPGIGPAKAKAIVEYRSTNPFDTAEELKDVKGIGDKLFATLAPYISVNGSAAQVPSVQ